MKITASFEVAAKNADKAIAAGVGSKSTTIENIKDGCVLRGLAEAQAFGAAFGESAGFIMFRAMRIAEPELIRQERAKRLFGAMDMVAHADDQGEDSFGFGFHRGKLVYCDGKNYRPLELEESAKVFFDVIDTGSWTGDNIGQGRWFRMVGKTLAAGKVSR